MPVTIANVNIATHSWTYLIERLNDVIGYMNTDVLTVNSTATGNSTLTGTYNITNIQSNTLNSNNLTVSGLSANTTSINITGNSTFAVNITANAVSTIIQDYQYHTVTSLEVTTTGTGAQTIDSFVSNTALAVDYAVTTKDNVVDQFMHSKISLLVANTKTTEYAILSSNGVFGIFSGDSNATHTSLIFTPSSANTTVKALKTITKT